MFRFSPSLRQATARICGPRSHQFLRDVWTSSLQCFTWSCSGEKKRVCSSQSRFLCMTWFISCWQHIAGVEHIMSHNSDAVWFQSFSTVRIFSCSLFWGNIWWLSFTLHCRTVCPCNQRWTPQTKLFSQLGEAKDFSSKTTPQLVFDGKDGEIVSCLAA